MSGDGGAARAVFADSLRRNRDLGWNENVMYCLVGIAGADVGLGLPERAARLLGAVFAVSETMDIARIRDRYANEVEARTAADARAQLGAERYEAAVAAGRELDLEAAIEYALGSVD